MEGYTLVEIVMEQPRQMGRVEISTEFTNWFRVAILRAYIEEEAFPSYPNGIGLPESIE